MLAILRWLEEMLGIESKSHIKGNRTERDVISWTCTKGGWLVELSLVGIIPSIPITPG